jgi:hypothetical protein
VLQLQVTQIDGVEQQLRILLDLKRLLLLSCNCGTNPVLRSRRSSSSSVGSSISILASKLRCVVTRCTDSSYQA